MRKTIESLGIFWTFKDKNTGNSLGQEEVDGLIFYAYWCSGYSGATGTDISSFKKIWKRNVELISREWEGEENCNISIEIKINKWPKEYEWLSCIKKSLEWFTDRGALLAWCGTEYCSPSLRMFYPGEGGDIYAAFNKDVGFFCGSGLCEEYKVLNDKCLVRFYYALLSKKSN